MSLSRAAPSVLLAVLVGLIAPTARAEDSWSSPFHGVRRLHRDTSNQHINVLVIDLCADGIAARATASSERRRTPSSFGSLTGAELVINGDFFSFDTYSTSGMAMHAGSLWSGTSDGSYDSPLAFGPDRAELVPHWIVAGPDSWMREIVSGHPTLVHEGEARDFSGDFCTARHPRTFVGLSRDRRTLYLAVADGRAPPSRIGMTCAEEAALMLELGAWNALNFDGGGSSAMWLSGIGVVNYPSDGSQRVVANHLGFFADGSGAAAHCPCVEGGETCNGIDDDCDGTTDESLSRTCGSDVGECRTGDQDCAGGAWGTCVGEVAPAAEACDLQDDDCDGATDEDLAHVCGSDVGECETGIQDCVRGAWGTCVGEVPPVPETCDELDNDCDGESDEEQICEIEEVIFQSAMPDGGGTTDIDGDGRADVCARAASGVWCHLSNATGFAVAVAGPNLSDERGYGDPAYGSTLRFGDVDGDGRADLCARSADGIACWRSTGSGFGAQISGPALSDAAGWNAPARYATLRLGDIDGDGRADLCGREAGGLRCWPSTGNGFGSPLRLDALADAAGFDRVERYGTLRVGDIDGDKRVDVCVRSATGVECWLGEGTAFRRRVLGPAWSDADGWDALDRWSTIRLADVDGDGRADLCGRTSRGYVCRMWTGSGFERTVEGPPLGDADGWAERERYTTIRLADVDGDGSSDICAREAEGLACWLWTGNGFGRKVLGPRLSDAGGWLEPRYFRTLRFADIDADARADVCARASDGVSCWLSDGHGFFRRVAGPAWSDEAGWDDARYYATMQLAGPEGRTGAGGGSAGCGCRTGGDRAPASGTLLLVALAWGLGRARARRRSRDRSPADGCGCGPRAGTGAGRRAAAS